SGTRFRLAKSSSTRGRIPGSATAATEKQNTAGRSAGRRVTGAAPEEGRVGKWGCGLVDMGRSLRTEAGRRTGTTRQPVGRRVANSNARDPPKVRHGAESKAAGRRRSSVRPRPWQKGTQ